MEHDEDQMLFLALGSTTSRSERVISALGQPYSPLDGACIVA